MEYKDMIRFVPAGLDIEESEKQTKGSGNCTITGEEAKTFYETLIRENSQSQKRSELYHSEVDADGKSCKKTKNETLNVNILEENSKRKCPVTRSQHMWSNAHVKQEPCDLEVTISDRKDLWKYEEKRDYENNKRIQHKFLSYAQNGDLQELKRLFQNEKYIDTDFQDSFGWTALMCAAVSKQFDVIRYLLSKGANKYILNNKGQTVFELCEEVGAIDASILINSYCRKPDVKCHNKETHTFICDVCKREFREVSMKEHERSMVHLFNLRLKPKADKYVIPEHNRGFQLMKKSGWDGETGLGPSGQGSKYPVKTCLKRDRRCLGAETNGKAKVTHFAPRDVDAVKSVHKHSQRVMSVKTISRRERKKRVQKSKQWERNLRTYMNIDI